MDLVANQAVKEEVKDERLRVLRQTGRTMLVWTVWTVWTQIWRAFLHLLPSSAFPGGKV
jgi:hypothetical protein